jgi:hypothetical protein
MTTIPFRLANDAVSSYKRLPYTAWHALAEMVDNSTQSYLNNRDDLDKALADGGERLEVSITYDRHRDGIIRVADNAMGMDLSELERALTVGMPPPDPTGRSRYGLGLKTSACWLGDRWTIRTKKLGESNEYTVVFDVPVVAAGNSDLPITAKPDQPLTAHHTIIEITKLNRKFHGRTLGKIKDFLRSMYRQDLRAGFLDLVWQTDKLAWDDSSNQFLTAFDGMSYRKDFAFEVDGNPVTGWVGVLERGSRAKAGFSILHAGRVVRGWPDSWRPEEIYGQQQGSNDLINQRLVGEIHLDDFEVSHTKDDILWGGDQEDEVQKKLREACQDYVVVARTHRKKIDDNRGPSAIEVETAVEEFQAELGSAELLDLITVESVPSPEVVAASIEPILEAAQGTSPTFSAQVGDVLIAGHLNHDMSLAEPYVVTDSADPVLVLVVINMSHPHLAQVVGSEGLLNYFRHCTYDAVAEWQSRRKSSSIDPDTVKLLKDRLLRVPLSIEMHTGA